MNNQVLEPILVVVLLLNFYILSAQRIRGLIVAVAVQGVVLALAYPAIHALPREHFWSHLLDPAQRLNLLRLLALTVVMVVVKGSIIPRLLFRALREADIRDQVETIVGILPTLLMGALGTSLALVFARRLPLRADHTSTLIVPAALATVLTGFLMLTSRRKAITQILGYIVLENGIFIFGLLLFEAIPILVELGVLLDLFVAVFVMGIIVNHVSRAFPSTSTEHLSSLRE